MVGWYWIPICLIIGVGMGIFCVALCVAGDDHK
jgi:hypothetical protein